VVDRVGTRVIRNGGKRSSRLRPLHAIAVPHADTVPEPGCTADERLGRTDLIHAPEDT